MQALVATPSRVLDKTLWRTQYDRQLLLDAKKHKQEVELHPILEYWLVHPGEDYGATRVGRRSGKSAVLLAQLGELSQNATWPPVLGLLLSNNVEHDFSDCSGECADSSWIQGSEGGPVTVEDFAKAYLQSLADTCEKIRDNYGGLGWHIQEIEDEEEDTVTFEQPTWEFE